MVSPGYIAGDVGPVGSGLLAQVLPIGQLFGEMKDGPQQVGEGFVLQQGGFSRSDIERDRGS
jgi:hypothetical protein